jgi:glutathione S-transferase
LDFIIAEIEPLIIDIILPILGYIPLDQVKRNKASAELTLKLKIVDAHLNGKNFFLGEKISLSDI